MACPDDNVAVEFATGEMPVAATAKVEAHLATCRDCRMLVAALAPAPGDGDSDLATPVRPALGKRGVRDLALASTDARRGSEPRRPLDPVVAVGDTIGRYVVLRRIGAGGMGVVFAAYDPQLDRRVALKLLRTGMGLGEGEARARLVREAQAIAQLSHPHVVAVYDVGTAATGDVYIAMEFIEGDTLTQWLSRWERSWRDVVAMFIDAGRGLAAAHAVGLLHRDFKPDNVLVGADGRVRVTDFGLARSLVTGGEEAEPQPARDLTPLRVTLTATGAVMGTPRYMAPEQLAGKDVSAAADQWSYCVALYEAVYGVHPIAGDTAAKMLEEGARMRPPPAGKGGPAALLPVLARGLDPVPARRFPSMSALLAEIAHVTRPPRRRYVAVAVAGAAALVLGGAAAATVFTPRRSAPRVDPVVIARLEEEIKTLRVERDEFIKQIQDAARDRARVESLVEEVAVRDVKIKELTQELEVVVAKLPQPKPVKPQRKPVAPELAPIIRKAITPVVNDMVACFVEWTGRTQETEGVVRLRVTTLANGRALSSDTLPNLEQPVDKALRECLEPATRRVSLGFADGNTRYAYTVVADFNPEGLKVSVTDVTTEAAGPLIENGGQ